MIVNFPEKSRYDSSRDTIGKIYRDINLKNTEDYIEIGDMSRELTTSLVEDINDAIKSFDKREKPYYLMVEEKKDLQMKQALCRRIHYFGYRPYPEDNTLVYKKNPKTQDLRFCWCLPHWAEMDLTLDTYTLNPDQFEEEYIHQIRAWKKVDLEPFGFVWHEKLRWIPNPYWEDKPHDYRFRNPISPAA